MHTHVALEFDLRVAKAWDIGKRSGHANTWRKSIPGRSNSQCKSPDIRL
jgi:hypothetical protein